MKVLSINDNSGYTLLELTVAVAIFSLIVVMSTTIFKNVVQSQRSALASQNIQESLRFAFENISREVRTANGNHSGSRCGPAAPTPGYYKVYNTNSAFGAPDSGNAFYFENIDKECVVIATTTSGQLEITRGVNTFTITPDEIEIKYISFFVIDDEAGTFHSVQPRVTIVMEAEVKSLRLEGRKIMKLQTTVSSRYYE